MTRGASGKPKTLGRLIFGEKRKLHASPSSRHRSASRHGVPATDVPAMNVKNAGVSSKSAINLHDWAVWRMQLNEQMASGLAADRADPKLMRQYLQANQFYQQHSRDPSNGRYNGARLLFSIPHAKMKADALDRSLATPHTYDPTEITDIATYNHRDVRSTSDDRTAISGISMSTGTPLLTDKTISQPRSKAGMYGKPGDFHRINEQMLAADGPRVRQTARNAYTAADRIHSTLQKAVKDGNVLEKIKAFEMQAAAAAQAESVTKLAVPLVNHRIQPILSPIQSVAHRALSPAATYALQQATSPTPVVQQQQQQQVNGRAHRGRHVYPTPHRREANIMQMTGPETRKGAHVLEPAHGDIILKRRTPSQKTVNDEDYSTTMISSMALPSSHSQHRQPSHHRHHQRRSSVSRSRHRQESVHDTRKAVLKEKSRPKSQSKHKEPTVPETTSPSKSSSRYRWLKGRKETPTESKGEEEKRDSSVTKSKKSSKNKKKHADEEKVESTKKSSAAGSKAKATASDNNRVYGVPNLPANEETKPEVVSSPTPGRIEEEVETEQPVETTAEKEIKEEVTSQSKPSDTTVTNTVERRLNKSKNYRQKLSSTDGEILEKIEDDARYSRPTDDHAQHSELNDDDDNPDYDDECRSEGDVFIEENSVKSMTNIPSPQQQQQQSANVSAAHPKVPTVERNPSDRRWHWSKESGGLIDKGNRKKKSNGLVRHDSTQEDSNHEQETFAAELPATATSPSHAIYKKSSFRIATITEANSEHCEAHPSKVPVLYVRKASVSKDHEQPAQDSSGNPSITDDFFDNGPHTNPEETLAKLTAST